MNPTGGPAEVFQFQGGPGQPGPAVVQHTTMTITTEPANDHIIWSLCCFVYSNPCCLGLAALIFSIKARDRRVVGDLEGARDYASTAHNFNKAATALFVGLLLISIIVISVNAAQVSAAYRRNRMYYGN